MCGFCGFIDNKNKNEKKKIIKNMANRIIHRGPDSEGYYTDSNIALGFRRLSIIDLKNGEQPIFNEDNSICVLLNGEIYNYLELRQTLIELGHTFKTNSDTEVILHGYEEYKTDIFSKLRGMFSIVLYDIKNKELIGARDFFGIKPFYYYKNENLFMVASEIKAFLDHPDFKKNLNTDVLQLYLSYGVNHLETTFFENVYKLKPGHYFKLKNKQFEIVQYFKLEYDKKDKPYEFYRDLVRKTINESIEYHKISDVEVGSYLSSGVDSSYITAKAKPNKTFTVGFDTTGFSEIKYARFLSKHLNIDNYSKVISGDEFFDILPTIQYYCDEPDAEPSAVPLYFLSKLAKPHVKVILSGEGSDEMFGGYNGYYTPLKRLKYQKIPFPIRKLIAILVTPFPSSWRRNILIDYGKKLEDRYYYASPKIAPKDIKHVLNKKYRNKSDPIKYVQQYYKEVKNENDVLKKIYLDLNLWLPDDILLKADKMSMANSIELRVPFLDKEVWNVSRQIPSKYFIKHCRTKEIFRSVAKEVLPESWAKRVKLGFPVPFGEWFKKEKYYKIIKAAFNEDYVKEFFNIKYINKILDEHYKEVKYNAFQIYTIYAFLIWYKKYFIEL